MIATFSLLALWNANDLALRFQEMGDSLVGLFDFANNRFSLNNHNYSTHNLAGAMPIVLTACNRYAFQLRVSQHFYINNLEV